MDERVSSKKSKVFGVLFVLFFFSSRRRHTRWPRDWSSDVCSSDLWFFIDANDLVPLRMTFDIQVEEEYSGTIEMNFRDYRSVSGVPMAFELEMVIDGISDSVSAEDMAEARKNIQELREHLDGASGMKK